MKTEKTRIMQSALIGAIGVLLWFITFHLLGIPSPMTHGLVAGSLIVLFGCLSLSKELVSFIFLFFVSPSHAKLE